MLLYQQKGFLFFSCLTIISLLIADIFLYSSALPKMRLDIYSDIARLLHLPVTSDRYGYYLCLPSILIDGNFGLHGYHHMPALSFVEDTGNFANKYPIGTAILILPFFVLVHIITIITGLPDVV